VSGDNTIGRLGQIVDLIRATDKQRAERAAEPQATDAPRQGAVTRQPVRQMDELRVRLVEALRAIDPDDPGSLKQGRRAVIRDIVLWEFGESLTEHPEFSRVLGTIESAIETDEGALATFTTLITELKTAG
jgi:hypothetical protein